MALTASGVAGFLPATNQPNDDRQDIPATEVEGRIYAEWEARARSAPGRPERAKAAPYSS